MQCCTQAERSRSRMLLGSTSCELQAGRSIELGAFERQDKLLAAGSNKKTAGRASSSSRGWILVQSKLAIQQAIKPYASRLLVGVVQRIPVIALRRWQLKAGRGRRSAIRGLSSLAGNRRFCGRRGRGRGNRFRIHVRDRVKVLSGRRIDCRVGICGLSRCCGRPLGPVCAWTRIEIPGFSLPRAVGGNRGRRCGAQLRGVRRVIRCIRRVIRRVESGLP